MKAKVKLGMGIKRKQRRRRRRRRRRQRKIGGKGMVKNFKSIVSRARRALKKSKPKTLTDAVGVAMKAVKNSKIKNKSLPRVIPVTRGGILPLLPIFAGLSAIGALTGGVSQVVKTVKDVAAAKKRFSEMKRHNQALESSVALGNGMFLKNYKTGYGLFLRPPPQESKN